jgi:type I restriction enzyme R subunit
MSTGPELEEVERPFIDQLVLMGWDYTAGDLDHPTATGRESFREVLLREDIYQALYRINLDPKGNPWLDEGRITQAVNTIQRLGSAKLLEANRKASELLLKGTVVDGVEGWEHGRGRTVHYIDWSHPENNRFRVINQFRLDCPTGQPKQFIAPDLVLFVNGIPLVVVEAKSPYIATPIEDAVNQLQRYANRRKAMGVVDFDEGNEQLFRYAQFLVATCGEQARVGTFSSLAVHFLEWKDTSPTPMAEVANELGKPGQPLTSQEKLVAGMLRPAHLLDIVRHFTLFMEAGGRTAKIVCRYQQFRAVQLAVQRMLTGKTRLEDGEQDRRGGIIWHTQGSGKSLTMVFLIRKMRSDATLTRFKVVVVTDRRDLEKQLSDTAALTGEVLTIVRSEQRGLKIVPSHVVLQETLRRKGKDLVFAMIQKYQGDALDEDETEDDSNASWEDDLPMVAEPSNVYPIKGKAPAKTEPLPELNTDQDILVLVDEAHRSHTSTAHANLMRALPNCVKIGFTGTPIIMREKGQTAKIFGDFIDRYTIRQSEADGSTVPILYEGRTTEAAVEDGRELDEVFEDMLVDRSPEELEAIKQKYATKGHVREAERLIKAKTRNILRHYVENILPNGFKAQLVAVSRRATIRYYEALLEARDELVEALQGIHPYLLALDDDAVNRLPVEKAFLVRAHRFLPTIQALAFAPVISGRHNDTVDAQGEWTSRSKIDTRIARFKKPLFAGGPNSIGSDDSAGDKADPLAFLIVKSMLLTGFDAPVEQVLYLDRHIKEAELLQAIARVNRTYARGGVEKGFGIVVDYYGVARHLKEALAAYSPEDVEGALQSMADEIPKLRDRHQRTLALFTSRNADISDIESCVQLLRDEKLRAEFHVKLRQFLTTMDLVLPRPEALPFVNDAKTLAHIQAKARNRYRSDERLVGKEVGEKVRKLIDDHIISLGINPRIPPIEITSARFDEHVERERSPRAKASEMEHALRYHIRKHLEEDPTHYEKLSERLKGILKELEGRWEELSKALKKLVEEARQGRRKDDTTGLDPETQAPFFDLLKQETIGEGKLDGEQLNKLCALTVELVDHIQQEISIVGFWRRAPAQEGLRSWIFQTLDNADLLPFERIDPVADRLLELAKANQHRLVS